MNAMVLDNVSKIQTSIYACGIFSPTLGQYEPQKYTFHNRGNCKIRAVKVMHTQKTHIPCQRQLKKQGRSRIKDVRKLQCYETEMCKISDFQKRCFFEMYVFDGFSKKQCFNFLGATQNAKSQEKYRIVSRWTGQLDGQVEGQGRRSKVLFDL